MDDNWLRQIANGIWLALVAVVGWITASHLNVRERTIRIETDLDWIKKSNLRMERALGIRSKDDENE